MPLSIMFSEANPSVSEYLTLRRLVGWGTMPETVVAKSMASHLFSVHAREEGSGQIVGMARVVGDGGLCFYIQDVIVHPDYQRRGIGKRLMKHVLSYVDRVACENSFVGLMAAKGKEEFYSAFGFDRRPNDHLGSGMTMFWRSPEKR